MMTMRAIYKPRIFKTANIKTAKFKGCLYKQNVLSQAKSLLLQKGPFRENEYTSYVNVKKLSSLDQVCKDGSLKTQKRA